MILYELILHKYSLDHKLSEYSRIIPNYENIPACSDLRIPMRNNIFLLMHIALCCLSCGLHIDIKFRIFANIHKYSQISNSGIFGWKVFCDLDCMKLVDEK